jgi:hypothetical protein
MISRRKLMMGASAVVAAAAVPSAIGATPAPAMKLRGVPIFFDYPAAPVSQWLFALQSAPRPEFMFASRAVVDMIEDQIRRGP